MERPHRFRPGRDRIGPGLDVELGRRRRPRQQSLPPQRHVVFNEDPGHDYPNPFARRRPPPAPRNNDQEWHNPFSPRNGVPPRRDERLAPPPPPPGYYSDLHPQVTVTQQPPHPYHYPQIQPPQHPPLPRPSGPGAYIPHGHPFAPNASRLPPVNFPIDTHPFMDNESSISSDDDDSLDMEGRQEYEEFMADTNILPSRNRPDHPFARAPPRDVEHQRVSRVEMEVHDLRRQLEEREERERRDAEARARREAEIQREADRQREAEREEREADLARRENEVRQEKEKLIRERDEQRVRSMGDHMKTRELEELRRKEREREQAELERMQFELQKASRVEEIERISSKPNVEVPHGSPKGKERERRRIEEDTYNGSVVMEPVHQVPHRTRNSRAGPSKSRSTPPEDDGERPSGASRQAEAPENTSVADSEISHVISHLLDQRLGRFENKMEEIIKRNSMVTDLQQRIQPVLIPAAHIGNGQYAIPQMNSSTNSLRYHQSYPETINFRRSEMLPDSGHGGSEYDEALHDDRDYGYKSSPSPPRTSKPSHKYSDSVPRSRREAHAPVVNGHQGKARARSKSRYRVKEPAKRRPSTVEEPPSEEDFTYADDSFEEGPHPRHRRPRPRSDGKIPPPVPPPGGAGSERRHKGDLTDHDLSGRQTMPELIPTRYNPDGTLYIPKEVEGTYKVLTLKGVPYIVISPE